MSKTKNKKVKKVELEEIKIKCMDCKKNFVVMADKEGLDRWKNGTPIQMAMPYLNSEDQTSVLAGSCKKCLGKKLAAAA